MPVPSRRHARRGFTLLECIVVIAVLGILAAVLIPVVARARSAARTTHCVSNMQQLGRAFTLYAQDHGGSLPPPVSPAGGGTPWFAALHPYAGKTWTGDMAELAPVFCCPAWEALPENIPTLDNIGYSMSTHLAGPGASITRPVSLAAIPNPSRAVVLIEWSGSPSIIFPVGEASPDEFAGSYTSRFAQQGCDRHEGHANYLFAYGHVSRLDPTLARSALAE